MVYCIHHCEEHAFLFQVKSNIPGGLDLETCCHENLETYTTSQHFIFILNNTDKLCLLHQNKLVKEVNRKQETMFHVAQQ